MSSSLKGKSFNVGTNQKKLYAAKMPEHFEGTTLKELCHEIR